MATHLTKYAADAVINVFRGTTYPAVPSHWFLALLSTAPTKNDMTGAVELISGTSGNYARQQVTPDTNFLTAPAQQGDFVTEKSTSNEDLTWATPSGNGLTATAFAIYDASTSGNAWAYGDLTTPIPWTSGIPITIPIGLLSLSVS